MRIVILLLLFFPLFTLGQTGLKNEKKDSNSTKRVEVLYMSTEPTKYQYDSDSNIIYTVVTKMPEFPEGKDSLIHYIKTHTKYPKACRDNNITGTIYVQFEVNPKGHIIQSKVLRSVHPLLDAEALSVVNSMPDWVPGEEKGKKVAVFYTVPVNF